jgi:hypothetical protein
MMMKRNHQSTPLNQDLGGSSSIPEELTYMSGNENDHHHHSAGHQKENYSDNLMMGPGEQDSMKRRLFDNLKKAGILDGMKSTLRVRLYEQLKLQNTSGNGVKPTGT